MWLCSSFITIIFVGALCVLVAADLSGTKLMSSPAAPGAAAHDVFVVFELPSAGNGHASGDARGADVVLRSSLWLDAA